MGNSLNPPFENRIEILFGIFKESLFSSMIPSNSFFCQINWQSLNIVKKLYIKRLAITKLPTKWNLLIKIIFEVKFLIV